MIYYKFGSCFEHNGDTYMLACVGMDTAMLVCVEGYNTGNRWSGEKLACNGGKASHTDIIKDLGHFEYVGTIDNVICRKEKPIETKKPTIGLVDKEG